MPVSALREHLAIDSFYAIHCERMRRSSWGPLEHTDAAFIDATLNINLAAPIHLTRAFIPAFAARGGGAVVNIASILGKVGAPNTAAYAASKAACIAYFDAVRAEVAGSGVGVHVVAPGYIATDHAASALGGDGVPDENAQRGMSPALLASQVAHAVERGEPQLIAAPLNARLAIWLRTLWPAALFRYMQTKAG